MGGKKKGRGRGQQLTTFNTQGHQHQKRNYNHGSDKDYCAFRENTSRQSTERASTNDSHSHGPTLSGKASDEFLHVHQDASYSNNSNGLLGEYKPEKQEGTLDGQSKDWQCSSMIQVQQQKQGAEEARNVYGCCCGDTLSSSSSIPQTVNSGHVFCVQCVERSMVNSKAPLVECEVGTHTVDFSVKSDSANTGESGRQGTSLNGDQASCTDKSSTITHTKSKRNNFTPVVTVGGDNDMKRKKNCGSPSTSQHDLPADHHNSKCLDLGVHCTKYCIGCKLWLCDKCAAFYHSKKRECSVISQKDALIDKKQQCENTVQATADNLKSSAKELEGYSSQLEAVLMLMRAAFEKVGKKHELIKALIQDVTQRKVKLEAEQAKFHNAKNLPQALAMFQNIDSQSAEAHLWLSEKSLCTGNTVRIGRMLKDMLYITFDCLQPLKMDTGMQSQIFVSKDLPTGKIVSELKADGGRICIQSLTRQPNVTEGTRLLPLEYIMSCVDSNSRLAFFDLSWGGHQQGRVYVRLTGNTPRGQQFVKLCTGETGPCFRGTRFHRIWWKGQCGEHVWGGDYEKGDGSGGQRLKEDNKDYQAPAEPSRLVPITAGLVAGRYEKDNISSIFRIYTKAANNVMEDTAFGHVEFGLNIIEKATKLTSITDVMIDDCGIVLEA